MANISVKMIREIVHLREMNISEQGDRSKDIYQ